MLTVALFRHAKSAWDDPELEDHERPLAKRGAADAPAMGHWLGRWLASRHRTLDLVLCSDAVRTRATLALALPELRRARGKDDGDRDPVQVQTEAGLYLAGPDAILASINAAPAAVRSLAVIGHNPGLHLLALGLTGDGERGAIRRLARGFPTAAIALLEFDQRTFAEVRPATGKLVAFMSPRRL